MFVLGCIFLVASAVALPAKRPEAEARPPIIDYAVPMGYYPSEPFLRSAMPVVIEEPKGEKHHEKGEAAIADAPILHPLDVPIVHEVVIENEPKKESEKISAKSDKAHDKDKPIKPEEETVKLEVAHPPIVRLSWPPLPSWLPLPQLPQLSGSHINLPFKLPDIPLVSNILSFANNPTSIFQPASYRMIPYPAYQTRVDLK